MIQIKKTGLIAVALALATTLCSSCGGGCGAATPTPTPDPEEIKVGGSVIIGSTTELSGSDFASAEWGNNAADKDIRDLTNGYACVEQTKSGEFVWNDTVVKDKQIVENADGTKTFTITLREGLRYSDGSPITAEDYVVYTLVMASPVCLDAGVKSQSGTRYVGYADFAAASAPTPFRGVRILGDLTFSYTISADMFPYYYELTYATFSPVSVKLWIGDDVQVRDDGEGAYLTEGWYRKTTDSSTGRTVYAKAAQIERARYATTDRPCSGPYRFVSWDKSEHKVTLEINKNYLGNYEGQRPHIQRLTYVKIVADTQLDQLRTGGVDIISGLAGGKDINAALELVQRAPDRYAVTSYLRSGYGKLQLMNDYGPTQFTKVRHALSHLLDKVKFASTYTGGFGSLVKGPYGLSSWMYQQAHEELESRLNGYEFSTDAAIALLEEDGWIYNADGTPYSGRGVRYKRLTASEASVNGNASYRCANTDYKTVKVGDFYYMPLAINWCSTPDNPISELLVIMLKDAKTTADAGMFINQEVVDFSLMLQAIYRSGEYSSPRYGMFNLATGFTPVYDYSGYWMTKYSKSNLLYAGVAPCEGATYTEADAAKYTKEQNDSILAVWNLYMSQGNMGYFADKELDELSYAMVYEARDKETFLDIFVDYIVRWNEVLPEITLYSDLYHDLYNAKIGGYEVNPDWGVSRAILYCYDKTAG